MDITRLAPAELDLDLADRLARIAHDALDGVPVPSPTGPSLMLAAQIGGTDGPDPGVWVATEAGDPVGYAILTLPTREYTDVAFVRGAVSPAYQRRGIGRALLAEVRTHAARPVTRVRTYAGTAGERALPALGFEHVMTTPIRELKLDLVRTEWAPARREAEAAATGYELVRRVGPTPPEELTAMVALREAINDAPDALEYEAYPPERIETGDQARLARRQTEYVVVARERATGEPAGLSMVVVDEFAPAVAHQEDTSVVRAHRGHRLGLLLKLDMIEWLRAERPEVNAIQTWNDQANHHMIAVNEKLGMTVVAESLVFRRA